MAKKVKAIVKLQIVAGKANPAPPVGPALGQHGVNIMAFCKEYNARTAAQTGTVIPVEITIFTDQSFTFVTKTPPAADLIKPGRRRAEGLGQAEPGQGRQAHAQAGSRDRRAQAEGPERLRRRHMRCR